MDAGDPDDAPRPRPGLGLGRRRRLWFGGQRGGEAAGPATLPLLGGTTSHTLLHSGHKRRYLLHRPAPRPAPRPGTASGPTPLRAADTAPLVVMLHGGFGWPEQAEHAYGWSQTADRYGFFACYPEGLFRTWNAGTCCGGAAREKLDDVDFLAAVIGDVCRAERIDLDRIYVTGMSNGAMMSYRLAAELPGRLAAIAPVAGTMTVPLGAAQRLSVLHIHGSADRSVPLAAGIGRRAFAADRRPGATQSVAAWRALAGCGLASVAQAGPVRTESAVAADGTTVELVTVVGAGHQWPGAVAVDPAVARLLRMDAPSDAFDATERIWQFFSAHPRVSPHVPTGPRP
jgi:polyhydroxybutyrate depolymerase